MLLTVTASLTRKTLWQDLFCTWFGLIIQWFTSTCLGTVFTAAETVLNMSSDHAASQIRSTFLQFLPGLYYIYKWLDSVWAIFLLLSLINSVQTGILMKRQRAPIIWEINYGDLSVMLTWPVANFVSLETHEFSCEHDYSCKAYVRNVTENKQDSFLQLSHSSVKRALVHVILAYFSSEWQCSKASLHHVCLNKWSLARQANLSLLCFLHYCYIIMLTSIPKLPFSTVQ